MNENLIQILPIEEDDFDALLNIEQSAHSVPWSLGTLKNNQGERYLNFKLLLDKQIIGFAICQFVLDEATLFNLAIHPKQQGKKFGFILLKYLIKQLQQRDIQTLWLEVRESNQRARALYEKMGFNAIDTRKNYYPTPDGKRENAIVMVGTMDLLMEIAEYG
ncbi:MAG: ribosomal protein S18-alanine N-acetyltransferase [Pasteurellaceae bacterium]|nr:ribosomal protein S18-alanine N-acetyltransferase [Pasteurellaceae bacterium]